MKIIITSGFFNPIHCGHISYLKEAKALGDRLFVIVKNDAQVKLKGSKEFLSEDERFIILENLKDVDKAFISTSTDKSVCADLVVIRRMFPDDELVYTKGGDQDIHNIPESRVCAENGIALVLDVGCKKVQSSSKILNKLDTGW
jgi:D-beta-D-heptose 7-phosphate kinase/D-beta-D-heptose 1-phosphate adenosyltransferase